MFVYLTRQFGRERLNKSQRSQKIAQISQVLHTATKIIGVPHNFGTSNFYLVLWNFRNTEPLSLTFIRRLKEGISQ